MPYNIGKSWDECLVTLIGFFEIPSRIFSYGFDLIPDNVPEMLTKTSGLKFIPFNGFIQFLSCKFMNSNPHGTNCQNPLISSSYGYWRPGVVACSCGYSGAVRRLEHSRTGSRTRQGDQGVQESSERYWNRNSTRWSIQPRTVASRPKSSVFNSDCFRNR